MTLVNHQVQAPFRYPVQYVIRPHLDYRGFAGQIASGVISKGDSVRVLPSGKVSTIKAIDTYDGEITEAFAPMSVTLRLNDEVDVSRGDTLVHEDAVVAHSRHVRAHLVWMHQDGLDVEKTYLIKHNTRYVRCRLDEVVWRLNMENLDHEAAQTLELNEIGEVRFTTVRAIDFDGYDANRRTGAFIVIDILSNATVAAGMIIGPDDKAEILDPTVINEALVGANDRSVRSGHKGLVVWIGEGETRSGLGHVLVKRLFDVGYNVDAVEASTHQALIAGALAHAGLVAVAGGPVPPEGALVLSAGIEVDDAIDQIVEATRV